MSSEVDDLVNPLRVYAALNEHHLREIASLQTSWQTKATSVLSDRTTAIQTQAREEVMRAVKQTRTHAESSLRSRLAARDQLLRECAVELRDQFQSQKDEEIRAIRSEYDVRVRTLEQNLFLAQQQYASDQSGQSQKLIALQDRSMQQDIAAEQRAAEIADLKRQNAALQTELDSSSVKIDELDGVERDLQAEIVQMKSERDQLQQDLTQAKSNHMRLQETFESSLAERENMQRSLDAAEATRVELQEEIEAIKSERDGLQSQVGTLTGEVANRDRSLAEAESTMTELQSQVDESKAALQELQTRFDDSEAQWQEKATSFETRAGELQHALDEAVSHSDSLQRTIDTQKSQLDSHTLSQSDSQRLLDEKMNEVQQLGEEIAQLRKDHTDAQAQVATRDQQIAEATAHSTEKEQQADERRQKLEEDLTQMREKLESSDADLASTRGQLTSSEADLASTRQSLESSKQEVERLASENGALTTRVEEGATTLAALELELQAMTAERDERAAAASSAEASLESLNQSIVDTNATHKSEVSDLQRETTRLHAEVSRLQKSLESTENQHGQTRDEQVETHKKEVADIHAEYLVQLESMDADHTRQVEETSKAHAAQVQEMADAHQTKLNEQAAESVRLQEECAKLAQARDELQTRVDECLTAKAALESELADVRSASAASAADAAQKLAHTTSALDAQTVALEESRLESSQSKSLVSELRAEVTRLSDELLASNSRASVFVPPSNPVERDEQLEQLRQRLESREATLASQTITLREHVAALAAAESRVDRLRAKHAEIESSLAEQMASGTIHQLEEHLASISRHAAEERDRALEKHRRDKQLEVDAARAQAEKERDEMRVQHEATLREAEQNAETRIQVAEQRVRDLEQELARAVESASEEAASTAAANDEKLSSEQVAALVREAEQAMAARVEEAERQVSAQKQVVSELESALRTAQEQASLAETDSRTEMADLLRDAELQARHAEQEAAAQRQAVRELDDLLLASSAREDAQRERADDLEARLSLEVAKLQTAEAEVDAKARTLHSQEQLIGQLQSSLTQRTSRETSTNTTPASAMRNRAQLASEVKVTPGTGRKSASRSAANSAANTPVATRLSFRATTPQEAVERNLSELSEQVHEKTVSGSSPAASSSSARKRAPSLATLISPPRISAQFAAQSRTSGLFGNEVLPDDADADDSDADEAIAQPSSAPSAPAVSVAPMQTPLRLNLLRQPEASPSLAVGVRSFASSALVAGGALGLSSGASVHVSASKAQTGGILMATPSRPPRSSPRTKPKTPGTNKRGSLGATREQIKEYEETHPKQSRSTTRVSGTRTPSSSSVSAGSRHSGSTSRTAAAGSKSLGSKSTSRKRAYMDDSGSEEEREYSSRRSRSRRSLEEARDAVDADDEGLRTVKPAKEWLDNAMKQDVDAIGAAAKPRAAKADWQAKFKELNRK